MFHRFLVLFSFTFISLIAFAYSCDTLPYIISGLAVLGTIFWVRGREDETLIIENTKGMIMRSIRRFLYSDSVFGGTLVGISATLSPFT